MDCLAFYTRLPLSACFLSHHPLDIERRGWAIPVAGAIIGLASAMTLCLFQMIGFSSLICAIFSVICVVLITGGLHEDGLADFVDGVGGGKNREDKLKIMRDSHIGSYGALAIFLALLLRVGAISALLQHGLMISCLALVMAAFCSRVFGLSPMLFMPSARQDGLGAMMAAPSMCRYNFLIGIVFFIAIILSCSEMTISIVFIALALSLCSSIIIGMIARRYLGGYTGDVLGAAQLAAEITALLMLSIA